MPLFEHGDTRRAHSVRIPSDLSLISSNPRTLLPTLAADADMSESQSHDSYAST